MEPKPPERPWSTREKLLAGGSLLAVLLILTVSLTQLLVDRDTPGCPSLRAAKMRLREARSTGNAAAEREATGTLAESFLCAHPEAGISDLRSFLLRFERPPAIQERLNGFAARMGGDASPVGRNAATPEARSGTAASRASSYLFFATADFGDLPGLAAPSLAIDPDRLLVRAGNFRTGGDDLFLFERRARSWRRTGTFTGWSDKLSLVWLDPDQRLAVVSTHVRALSGRMLVLDLADRLSVLREMPGVEAGYWVSAARGEIFRSLRPIPGGTVGRALLSSELRFTRVAEGVRIDEAVRPESLLRERLVELLDGPAEARAEAAADPEIAAFLGHLRPADVLGIETAGPVHVECGCGADRCSLATSWEEHALRITAVSVPKGCVPFAPGAARAR